jgi:hypothetical protein
MSLVDRTNETILLSQHKSQTWDSIRIFDHELEAGSYPASLNVDADGDSSCDPSQWVHINWTDDTHDADRIKLTYDEADQLYDRLGLILGKGGQP